MFATQIPSTRLLDIHTGPMHYVQPNFLDDITASRPFPMVVDGELGTPLDLSCWDCLWEYNEDNSGA